MSRILILDDEREIGSFLSRLFSLKGHQVVSTANGSEFQKAVEQEEFQLAMLDLKLPDTDGLSMLKVLKSKQPSCKAIIMTGYSTIQSAIEAMKLGAIDYIEKPFDDINQLEQLVEERLSTSTDRMYAEVDHVARQVGLVIGTSEDMHQLLYTAYKIASKNINVLIEGETGTGKEVLARFMHQASGRPSDLFFGVNCGAITETLLESELFGHEKGAFTGATQSRKGYFEMASEGTLFLDEIAEAAHPIQVKLLRVLETREFMRVGSEKMLKTHARVIAASHANLAEEVKEKRFREDLLYRLNVVKLTIPPLRNRVGDLQVLINQFLKKEGMSHVSFSTEAMDRLKTYDWPGNIRELKNTLTRMIALIDPNQHQITLKDLEQVGAFPNVSSRKVMLETHHEPPVSHEAERKEDEVFDAYLQQWSKQILQAWRRLDEVSLEEILEQVKQLENVTGRAFVKRALQKTYGDRKKAAELLDINYRKLRYLLNEKE